MANLILCEKPDMARKIASGIDRFDKGSWVKGSNGMQYFHSKNFYVVALRGHLIEYVDFEDYEGKMSWKESIALLPYVPTSWKSRPLTIRVKDKDTGKIKKITDPDVKKRLDLIKEIYNFKDTECLINCCDADSEGDNIFLCIKKYLQLNKKPIYRMLCKDLVIENIETYFKERLPEEERIPTYRMVEARSKSDWVLGINLTRFATVMANEQNGKVWNVGRVSTCIVKLIYDREKEIQNFKPVDYYKLVSNTKYNDIDVELKSEAEFDLDELNIAKRLCADFNSKLARVKKVEHKDSISNPPRLFSQTTLQNVLSQRFGFSADETLAYSQVLYEEGLTSYPRTNSNFIGDEFSIHERITGRLNKMGYAVDNHKGDKNIYDASKVESHSAITPTINLVFSKEELEKKVGSKNIINLWNTYKTIFDRYCAVFCSEKRKVAKTVVEIEVGNQAKEIIKLRGEVEKEKGWSQFEKAPSSNSLPNFKEGETFSVNFIPVKSSTKPPKHYTVTTLNNKLKNPLKKQSEDEDESIEEEITDEDIKNLKNGITIGTEASKPTILKTALDNEIIAMGKNKKDYLITPKGIALIELLEKNGVVIDVNTTVKVQVQIQQVYDDKLSVQDLLEMNKEQLDKWIDKEAVANLTEEGVKYNKEEPLGKCLCCGNDITALKTKTGDKFYKCQNKDCKFVLFEKDKFFERFGKTITLSNVKSLLKYKRCKVTGLINKANKKYDAYFCIDEIKDGRPQWKLEFINDYKKKE